MSLLQKTGQKQRRLKAGGTGITQKRDGIGAHIPGDDIHSFQGGVGPLPFDIQKCGFAHAKLLGALLGSKVSGFAVELNRSGKRTVQIGIVFVRHGAILPSIGRLLYRIVYFVEGRK